MNSDNEKDDSEGPTQQIHRQSTSDSEEDEDDAMEEEDDDEEDDGLQHLPAFKVEAMLQEEVKNH